MISAFLKLFSGRHYRQFYKRCQPIIRKINRLEEEYQALSDEAIQAKTAEFMKRHADGETLDDLMPEAFAVVKNTARRLCGKDFEVCGQIQRWDMVHYDVQLMGGVALHSGKIAEMATGEGKTLVSTLPLYLNALTGRNCQLVTVNEYLAQRDSEWMGQIFRFLGLTVGCISHGQNPEQKRAMYGCNITYGTASEFGFDYLRDNGMSSSRSEQVQKEHFYVIVDEVDSILVDEARTPLIISGPSQDDNSGPYLKLKPDIERLVRKQKQMSDQLANDAERLMEENTDEAIRLLLQLKIATPKHEKLLSLIENGSIRRMLEKYETEMQGDFRREEYYRMKEELYFTIDEKNQQADLTEKGRVFLTPDDPDAFMLPDLASAFVEIEKDFESSLEEKQQKKLNIENEFIEKSQYIHCISQLLRAYTLYQLDDEYVVQDGKVMIVDDNTGRIMPGRRWSEGLHQAIEAKESVQIEKETKTYATITIQNYFRLYEKLAGMTGTAETEATEFNDIYKLGVMVIPTNKPCIRIDQDDVIYKTKRDKFKAVITEIDGAHRRGQPVLVGTVSVESSEQLSRMLKQQNIPHTVLNAKLHQQEAEVIARAGQRGAVTIATNMAGRGTDIKLGEGVRELGGLLVLGTERHESRRIDRQLRGRCSRQGDPGSSKFYVSLEDDLMRLFASNGPIAKILEKTFQEGEELAHPLLNRSIESAQKKVEQYNFSIRKRLLQYDDVLNKQREVVYGIRNDALLQERPKDLIFELIEEEIVDQVDSTLESGGRNQEENNIQTLIKWLILHFPYPFKPEDFEGKSSDQVVSFLMEKTKEVYSMKEGLENPDYLGHLERFIIIRAIDQNWQNHLTEMEDLRRSVNLRGYGQKDPLNEYKNEAYKFFEQMVGEMRRMIFSSLFRASTNAESYQELLRRLNSVARESRPEESAAASSSSQAQASAQPRRPVVRELPKIGRNELVTIRRNGETQTVKFKKAEAMIRTQGWEFISKD